MNKRTGWGWRAVRNRFNAFSRELGATSAIVRPMRRARPVRALVPVRATRTAKTMTPREAVIKTWYLYGGVDALPPEGLTDAELLRVRERFCK